MAEGHTRVGWGFDAHRFGPGGPLILCGVEVDDARGLEATSDGDVAAHALIDALLGADGMGDLGAHFASDDPGMQGADSMELLVRAVRLVESESYRVGNVDVLRPHGNK
ncbi:MAG: 2-C-methyl-D-erythritol 2,4-cyclodiphosphate synthase [Acidimicrobiia bacterium]